MSVKSALITGITGQDGAYLARLLLQKGYEVHGLQRPSASINTYRIDALTADLPTARSRLHLHMGDVTDLASVKRIFDLARPDEVYNLAAQSHVQVSFEAPEYTSNANALGVLRLLDAIRTSDRSDSCRFYQASTSELFGLVRETPQSETTPFHPRSPYGVAKLYGYWITLNYREAYGLHASNGILFNHESPYRGVTFVTRKITHEVAQIQKGRERPLAIGNLDAKRDWGHARDYVEGMWLMLQQDTPDDYVLATGELHSVREFIEKAFNHVGVTVAWEGVGVDERGFDAASGREIVRVDPQFFRPAEVSLLLGNPAKARAALGWRHQTTFDELVIEMMDADLAGARV